MPDGDRQLRAGSCEIGKGSLVPDPHPNWPDFVWNRCKRLVFFVPSEVVAADNMKRNLSLVSGALGGLAFLHFGAFAETDKPNATATPSAAISAKKTEKDCDDEWRANQEAMIRYNMTEESYVEQCRVADDVPPIPESKMNAAPSAEPK
jgi:hypothetical protein